MMEIIKKRIADMERAAYNPRVELRPGDDEYEALKYSLETMSTRPSSTAWSISARSSRLYGTAGQTA